MNDANVSWTYYYKDGIFLAQFQDFFDPKIEPKTVQVSDLLSRLNGVCSGNPCDPDKALPQVIFIDSPSGGSGLDEHPENNVQKGAAFVQSIISALMNSDAWNDSIFILSYDEGGGLYDHVPRSPCRCRTPLRRGIVQIQITGPSAIAEWGRWEATLTLQASAFR